MRPSARKCWNRAESVSHDQSDRDRLRAVDVSDRFRSRPQGRAAESVVISAFYLYYRDSFPMVYSVAMAIVAAFIAYGRFALRPL